MTYLLVLLFWQPQQLVFVDRVCISQTDPGLQAEGLLSLGAILKSSDSVLAIGLRNVEAPCCHSWCLIATLCLSMTRTLVQTCNLLEQAPLLFRYWRGREKWLPRLSSYPRRRRLGLFVLCLRDAGGAKVCWCCGILRGHCACGVSSSWPPLGYR